MRGGGGKANSIHILIRSHSGFGFPQTDNIGHPIQRFNILLVSHQHSLEITLFPSISFRFLLDTPESWLEEENLGKKGLVVAAKAATDFFKVDTRHLPVDFSPLFVFLCLFSFGYLDVWIFG